MADGSIDIGTSATMITGDVGVGPRESGSLLKATIDGHLFVELVSVCGSQERRLRKHLPMESERGEDRSSSLAQTMNLRSVRAYRSSP